jgi:hypothetical protein
MLRTLQALFARTRTGATPSPKNRGACGAGQATDRHWKKGRSGGLLSAGGTDRE